MRRLAWMTALMLSITSGAAGSDIGDDDRVIFFPTYAQLDEDAGVWELHFHGWIFEPEEDSRKRAFARSLLRRILKLKPKDEQAALYRRRTSAFLVDNESGKEISIRLGDRVHPLEESGDNGHFYGRVRLAAGEVETLAGNRDEPVRWLDYTAVCSEEDDREFAGSVALIPPEGVSIISDLDDTIRLSNVLDRQKLLEDTFLRDFQPVPGMAEFYGRWAAAGAAFHYVSASPWQLYEPVEEFRRRAGFPAGTFHMRYFRLSDRSARDLLGSPEELKRTAIEPILESFPGRLFICIGDSGERDPEIYASLARRFPHQIAAILIRDLGGETPGSRRFEEAFEGLPPEKWRLFSDPSELADFEFLRR